MFKKIRSVLLIFVISVCLCVCSIKPVKTKAFAFTLTAAAVYEIIQTILISAGITYVTYQTISDFVERQGFDFFNDSVLDQLNAFSPGLGSSLADTINAAVPTDTATKVIISDGDWNKIRSFAQAVASGSMPIISGSTPVSVFDLSSVVQLVTSTVSVKPKFAANNDFFWTRYAGSSSASAQWQTLATNYAGENPLIYGFYFLNQYETVNTGDAAIYLLAPSAPVVRYNTYIQSYNKRLQLLDASGSPVSFVYQRLYLEETGWKTYSSSSPTDVLDLGTVVNPFDNVDYPNYLEQVFAKSGIPFQLDGKGISNVSDLVVSGSYDVVTPGRTVTETGELSGSVTISVPTDIDIDAILPGIIDGTGVIGGILDDVGVVPVDTDTGKTVEGDKDISDVVDDVNAPSFGGIGDYALPLADFFPFCLPFDFYKFISCLAAEPVTPEVDIKFPTNFSLASGGVNIEYTEYTVDLHQFDDAAAILRKFELLLFVVGLILVTRSHFIRG